MKHRFPTNGSPELDSSSVWFQRAQQLREHEWQLHLTSLSIIENALDRYAACPFEKITVSELTRLIDLAFKLGRRAVGLPLDGSADQTFSQSWQDQPAEAAHLREIDRAINEVYGPENPPPASPPQPPTEPSKTEPIPSPAPAPAAETRDFDPSRERPQASPSPGAAETKSLADQNSNLGWGGRLEAFLSLDSVKFLRALSRSQPFASNRKRKSIVQRKSAPLATSTSATTTSPLCPSMPCSQRRPAAN
jgi:hypothetical protein